ncbi:hypothetical protein BJ875DRAFT_521473, partial [Amylocarpus encephaloides]
FRSTASFHNQRHSLHPPPSHPPITPQCISNPNIVNPHKLASQVAILVPAFKTTDRLPDTTHRAYWARLEMDMDSSGSSIVNLSLRGPSTIHTVTRIMTLTTRVTAPGKEEGSSLWYPWSPITQDAQTTTVLKGSQMRTLPILLLTEIVGVDGTPLNTATLLQKAPVETTPPSSAPQLHSSELLGSLKCSAWRCWSSTENIGIVVAGIVIGSAIIAVIIWGLCLKPKEEESMGEREEKERGSLSTLLWGGYKEDERFEGGGECTKTQKETQFMATGTR